MPQYISIRAKLDYYKTRLSYKNSGGYIQSKVQLTTLRCFAWIKIITFCHFVSKAISCRLIIFLFFWVNQIRIRFGIALCIRITWIWCSTVNPFFFGQLLPMKGGMVLTLHVKSQWGLVLTRHVRSQRGLIFTRHVRSKGGLVLTRHVKSQGGLVLTCHVRSNCLESPCCIKWLTMKNQETQRENNRNLI